MTRREILQLNSLLTPNSPYFEQLLSKVQGQAHSELQRSMAALRDPAFGRNVAGAHAAAGLGLPGGDWPEPIRRIYQSLSHPEVPDALFILAELLHLPENQPKVAVMRALLLCPDGTNERIAEFFDYPAGTIKLVDQAYFNVRDRRNEVLYLERLRQAQRAAGDTLGFQLLTMAMRGAPVEVVLDAAGLSFVGCS